MQYSYTGQTPKRECMIKSDAVQSIAQKRLEDILAILNLAPCGGLFCLTHRRHCAYATPQSHAAHPHDRPCTPRLLLPVDAGSDPSGAGGASSSPSDNLA